MKTEAIHRLRQKLAADETTYGVWVTLESASVTEMAVAMGVDWVVIDAEHGHLDWQDVVQHVRATVRSQTVALVRIAELQGGLIKRALDLGADGVVVPWVENADQLRQAIAWAKYPPEGLRGIGAERATAWGQALGEHTHEANDHVLVVPIIETASTYAQVPHMAQVEGAELFFFGPADYSSTAGFRGQWEGPGVAQQILDMKDVLRRAGKYCGLIATSPENLLERRDQGFRLVGLGMDAGLLLRSLRTMLETAGRRPRVRTSLAPEEAAAPVVAAARGPERAATITPRGKGVPVELGRGVMMDCLAGAPQHARGLTVGIAAFEPSAALPCHRHTFAEALTLLEGAATVDVEGRIHTLRRFDTILIPAGRAHQTRNSSTTQIARFHVALASDKPGRELVETFFPKRMMPEDSIGAPGAERVARYAAWRRDASSTLDCFNARLTPGVEMSGGRRVLAAGERWAVPPFDADLTLCIFTGQGTLEVRGRRQLLPLHAVALVPAGEPATVANEAPEPLDIAWVVAKP
ncbi:MAG: aldolase/citrate lyase family protein [Pirellulales bacterium]